VAVELAHWVACAVGLSVMVWLTTGKRRRERDHYRRRVPDRPTWGRRKDARD